MGWDRKYQVFLGIFLVHVPNGITWYYGNLSSYAASALRYYLGPKVDVETVWLLSVFIGLWTTGLTLGALLQRVFPRPRLIALGGILVFDAAFAATAWTIRHSLVLYVTSFGAIAGLADGFVYTACIAFIPMWEKRRVGLATALSTSGLGVGAVVINQVVSRYVNPNNEVADKPDGNIMLFSQEEIVTQVPNLFLLLAVFNFVFHISGILLLKTKSDDIVEDTKENKEAQQKLLDETTKPDVPSKGSQQVRVTECVKTSRSSPGVTDTAKCYRPRLWSLNGEAGLNTGDNLLVSKASPWSSDESSLSDWPKLPVCCGQCNSVGHPDDGGDTRNMTAQQGQLETDLKPRFVSETLCQLCDSKIDGHDRARDTNVAAFSAPAELRKGEISNGDRLDFFRLWSNSIPSGYKDYKDRWDGSCGLNSDSNVNKTDNVNKIDNVNNNKINQSPENQKSDFQQINTPTHGNPSSLVCYGSTQHTDTAEDLSSDSTDLDLETGCCYNTGRPPQTGEASETRNITPGEMVCSKMFFVLWVTQFSMDYSLSVLTNYYKLYGELYIQDDHFLAYLGTIMTASIIIPKLGWGWLLDLWGVKATLVCMTSSTVVISSFWFFTATINRYLYFVMVLGLCWCVSAFDSLAAAAVLLAFGPAHFNVNYGIVASSSIFFNIVTPLGMKGLVDFLGWAGLFLSAGVLNFIVLVLTLFYSSK